MSKAPDLNAPLSIERIFGTPDEPATEPVPPRIESHTYRFRATDGPVKCVSDGALVEIQAVGSLQLVAPPAIDEGLTSADELAEVAREGPPLTAFRPPWLDLHVAPHIWPRPISIPAGPMRLLSVELCLVGYPWSAIGKVVVTRTGERPKVGSGVLVGPNLLLTASHGMPWGTKDASIRFSPGYLYGDHLAFGAAYVERFRGVVVHDGDVNGLDYVICKLDWRIGERSGWLGSQWTSDEDWYYDHGWISVGYPSMSPSGGEAPSLELPAWVEDIDNDADGLQIETDHFTSRGWSGGPLWGWIGNDPRVIGICSGFEKDGLDPTRAVFAGGEHLVNLVKHGWANWT